MKALVTALRTQAAARAERFERERPKWQKPRYPHREELVYYRRLRYFVELVQYIIERDIVPQLPGLLESPTTAATRQDSADDIDEAFAAAAQAAAKAMPDEMIQAAAQSTALRVTEWSADQFQQQIQKVVKVNLYDDSSGMVEHLELFVSDNVKLIKSLTGQHLIDVKGIVTRGARSGAHHLEVRKQIQQQLGITKRRAALIASDQIGKLNGEINQIRQTNLGVKRYRWSTSLDERVRKTHRSLEGSIQEWAKPPVVDPRTGERGHPGQPIRCRCSAIPIIDDVLAEAGLIAPEDVELTHPRQGEQPPLRTPPAILPRTRPPPAPEPPTPPPIPPPPVPQRTDPPVDPAAALRSVLPTQPKVEATEAKRATEAARAQVQAQETTQAATQAAAREFIASARAAKVRARGLPPIERREPEIEVTPPEPTLPRRRRKRKARRGRLR